MKKLDFLAIGVHPDDIELGCAGTLIAEARNGKSIGIIDLTEGELGSRGTRETRKIEAAAAAVIIGTSIRENLQLRDGFFQNNEESQMKIIQKLRQYRPEIVFSNVLSDRHPDHGRAGSLINDACFLSGLLKIETTGPDGMPQEKWRPKYVFQYIQDWYHEPDFVIDITDTMEEKLKCIQAYSTQFYSENADPEGPQTYISSPDFFESIKARSRQMGKKIGVKYGEGFKSTKTAGFKNLDGFILNET